jgi:hypothetical protein
MTKRPKPTVKDNCRTLGQEHDWKRTKAGHGDTALSAAIAGWKRCTKCGWATAPALSEGGK